GPDEAGAPHVRDDRLQVRDAGLRTLVLRAVPAAALGVGRIEAFQRAAVVVGIARVVAAHALVGVGERRRAERGAVLAAQQQGVGRAVLDAQAVGRAVGGVAVQVERVVARR